MAVLTGDVLDSARTHMADVFASDWTDPEILAKFQEAHRELQLQLFSAGLPMMQNVSPVITVPPNTTDYTTCTGYPTDILLPTWIVERLPGQDASSFVDMTPRDFLPFIDPDQTRLIYWAWQQYKVQFIGCTSPVETQMRYRCGIAIPQLNTDPIGILQGETYLSFRTAALCLEQMPGQEALAQTRNAEAMDHIGRIVQLNVTLQAQMLPTKRQPYHRRRNNNGWWFGGY